MTTKKNTKKQTVTPFAKKGVVDFSSMSMTDLKCRRSDLIDEISVARDMLTKKSNSFDAITREISRRKAEGDEK